MPLSFLNKFPSKLNFSVRSTVLLFSSATSSNSQPNLSVCARLTVPYPVIPPSNQDENYIRGAQSCRRAAVRLDPLSPNSAELKRFNNAFSPAKTGFAAPLAAPFHAERRRRRVDGDREKRGNTQRFGQLVCAPLSGAWLTATRAGL